MRSHPHIALGTILATAALSIVVPVAPAQAAAITGGQQQVGRSVSETGPATCTVTNPSVSPPISNFTSNGATTTATAAATSTITDDADPADATTVEASVRQKLRATESGGTLRSVSQDVDFDVVVDAAQGLSTDCDASTSLGAVSVFDATFTKAQWVTMTVKADKGKAIVISQLTMNRTAPASPPEVNAMVTVTTGKSSASKTALLPPGTYTFSSQHSNSFAAPQSASEPQGVDSFVDVDITFADAGSAIGKSAGTGKKYLKLGKSVNCGTNKLTSKFTNAAGIAASAKLKKATFFVNGKKKKSIGLPTKGDKVTLTNLKSSQQMDVKVVLQPFRGAPVTVALSYLSCT